RQIDIGKIRAVNTYICHRQSSFHGVAVTRRGIRTSRVFYERNDIPAFSIVVNSQQNAVACEADGEVNFVWGTEVCERPVQPIYDRSKITTSRSPLMPFHEALTFKAHVAP